jgi:hypothetical protein
MGACFALASCTLINQVSDSQPVLTTADIVGTWSNHNGSTITFKADGTFSGVAMPLGPLPEAECDHLTDTGQWEFADATGSSPTSGASYASGNQVLLTFGDYEACDSSLTTWGIDPPVGLCTEWDPDSPCMGTPWTKEHGG